MSVLLTVHKSSFWSWTYNRLTNAEQMVGKPINVLSYLETEIVEFGNSPVLQILLKLPVNGMEKNKYHSVENPATRPAFKLIRQKD